MCIAPATTITQDGKASKTVLSTDTIASEMPVFQMSNSSVEVVVLCLLWAASFIGSEKLDVSGSGMSFRALISLLTVMSLLRREYTGYLERSYDAYPEKRTQPARKQDGRDPTGRDRAELDEIEWHDRATMFSTLALTFVSYYAIPTLYPVMPVTKWMLLRGLLHHYALSFGMYWAHRNLHVHPWFWRVIHSKHHYAKTPLARTTYMDHWADNFFNAVISELCTQILVPLPTKVLFASRLFRVCESLEKHSGLCGPLNVAHTMQRWLPFAAMPHHHDWHHEGHKNSNYTFASLGGVWDVAFGTRHFGRAGKQASVAATARDLKQQQGTVLGRKSLWDHPLICPMPLLAFFAATIYAHSL